MSRRELRLDIASQPDDTTCGPTCLHAVYRFFRDELALETVIDEVCALDGGGTLASLLGHHALGRGYRAILHSVNLRLFDPTWFGLERRALLERLRARMAARPDEPRWHAAGEAYVSFLERGGELRFADLSARLILRLLDRELPVLTGLSATWLYRESRELADGRPDDVAGDPVGHFVVLCGYDERTHKVRVADPLHPDPSIAAGWQYDIPVDRLVNAILLGVLTFDANLLQIEPSGRLPIAGGKRR